MFKLKKKPKKQQMRVQMNDALKQSVLICKLKARLKKASKK